MGMVSESSKRAASGSEARERGCAPAQSSSSPGTSRIDRQLDRISKMLAQSTINTHSSNTLTQTNGKTDSVTLPNNFGLEYMHVHDAGAQIGKG